LNVFYNIQGIFAEKSIGKIVFLKSTELSTEYRYRRYFFLKCTVIGAVATFLAKYQYRYRRYF